MALDSLKYTNTVNYDYKKDTTFSLVSDWVNAATALHCSLKNDKELIFTAAGSSGGETLIIKAIHGIK